jgi:predicted ATPase
MARTLQQLQQSVDQMIKLHGESAPCAAYIFTKEDVYEVDSDGDFFYLSDEITCKVLADLDDTESVLKIAFDCIDDFVNAYKK